MRMTPKICATFIALALGIIALQCVTLYYVATHDRRQTAIVEDAINNVLFIEYETHQ